MTRHDSAGTSPSPPTRRVVETMRVLAHGPLGHGEVARRVGMTPATTHAVLAELVACGWVERDAATRRYRLGADLVAWAAPLVRPENRIREAVGALAALLDLPVLFGRVRETPGRAPVLVVEDTDAFRAGRPIGQRLELPFTAPFGSVIAAHAGPELRAAWLPQNPALSRLFQQRLDEVAARGHSVEAYGPHIAQMLLLLSSSADDIGWERAARLTEDLQLMIAGGDHDLAAKYPALLSVPVATGHGCPGSLTLQMRRTEEDPAPYLPVLRSAAEDLERALALT